MASAPAQAKIEIGRVVNSGFRTLGRNFLPFFALSLLVVGTPTFFIYYLLDSVFVATIEGSLDFTIFYYLAGSVVLGIVTSFLLQGILIRASVLHLGGHPPALGASAAVALRLLLPLIGLSFLVGLLVGIGFVMLIVPGIMVYIAFSVAVPALIEERKGVLASMRRSRDLTRGSRGQIFILVVLFYVISMIATALLDAVLISPNPFAADPAPIRAGLSGAISGSLIAVVVAVMLAALYVELRTVKEGMSRGDLVDIFG
jgi:hypothetical protein